MKVISAADIARTATFVFVFAFDVTKSQYNVSNKRFLLLLCFFGVVVYYSLLAFMNHMT